MSDKEIEQSKESLAQRVLKIGEELAALEIKLQTNKRTAEDFMRHMQLIKELRSL